GHFPGQDLSDPPAACFILVSSAGQPLRTYSRNFDFLNVTIPVNSTAGSVSFQLTAKDDPRDADALALATAKLLDPTSDSNDPAAMSSLLDSLHGDFCYWRVTQGSVRVAASLGGTRLMLRSESSSGTVCTAADPWGGPGGSAAPEGWLSRLGFLLRLQYDVLTLRT
ncbi:hypothetical protein Agub_g15068, partial [Astrephomene gubernaculifera]